MINQNPSKLFFLLPSSLLYIFLRGDHCPAVTTNNMKLGVSGSLWTTVFKDKYCKHKKFLEVPISLTKSPRWNTIDKVKHILSKGACRQQGNGESNKNLEDPWVPRLPSFKPQYRV